MTDTSRGGGCPGGSAWPSCSSSWRWLRWSPGWPWP